MIEITIIYRQVKKHPNNTSLMLYYTKYKNTFTKILRLTKINFYQNKINSVASNPKLTWRLINEITNKNVDKAKEINSIQINKQILYATDEPQKIANIFNTFFVDIGSKLAENNIVEDNPIAEVIPLNGNSYDNIFNDKITETDILLTLKTLKDDTAAGVDKITVKLLKTIINSILGPLLHIYNLSIKYCLFPEKFKIAVVAPLFKGGNRTEINNYRPISMIVNFAKLLEKIIKNRLMKYLESNNLLSKNQFGFRPGLSTEDALYSVTKFISNSLDNGEKTLAIFLDLKKAFDTVNHIELIKILPTFGIINKSLLWFTSYLDNRLQLVNVNGILGEKKSVVCGVPQGSVLGPILFILYINNVCNTKLDGQVITYADDTCLLFSGATWKSVHDKATNGLNEVVCSLTNRKLSLNTSKNFQ